MKKYTLCFLTLLFSSVIYSQDILTTDIFGRVFNIKYGKETATCFLIQENKKIYFVTARHLFQDTTLTNTTITVNIRQGNEWKYLQGKLLLHKNPFIDIALIEPFDQDTIIGGLVIDKIMIPFSDRGFFLGYP